MKTTWLVLFGAFSMTLAAAPVAAQKPNASGCKDLDVLSRLPEYWIQACTLKQFDAYKFASGKGTTSVEGQFTNIRYQPRPDLEVAKLLKSDAGLKLFVVGHADNVGGLDGSLKLSQDRTASVVQALVKTHGIEVARLKAFGAGPYAPVTSNDTDEGRAKNRRVELVRQ